MSDNIKITDLLTELEESKSSLIKFEEVEEQKDTYASTHFREKEAFIKDLFEQSSTKEISTTSPKTIESENILEGKNLIGSDVVYVYNWKNIENISARLIEYFDNVVVLECLIDKEEGVYEEREFKASLFEGYDLSIGTLFYLRYFERQNEARLEIHNNPELTLAKDFPKKNFDELFKTSKLFK